ncbi:hypothetical protein [Lentzea guizhouensis]|uniref:hypothetical protein n=1 Tax=Lentzea guizhouensis TaxID=1586287 RepID=UPI0012B67E9D|nr:hypothetical protein [Lentzea guizhouensis]
MEYTRRDLALAYLEAYPMPEHHQVDPESLYARLKVFHTQLLAGLEQLFAVDLKSDRFAHFFFGQVARSYRDNRHPTSGMLESGPLFTRPGGTELLKLCNELATLHEWSQKRLVDLTVELLAMVKPDHGEVVTTEQLRAIGVDTVKPTDPDGEWR